MYTIREIARELALPESTVRYYRDAFVEYVPAVGTGRRRRYPADAVAILRLVAHGFATGKSREEIAAGLRGRPRPAVEHQPPVLATRESELLEEVDDAPPAQLSELLEEMEALREQHREVEALREQLEVERQLVERLRRSKLEIEHRAAQAEARLAEQEERPRRRSVLGRLLKREPLEGERGG